MFIAMNRFKIKRGQESAFEAVWRERDSHLKEVPGFQEFHLPRGPEAEDHTLYASHTIWASRDRFEDWTQSEAFRKAHAEDAKTQGFKLTPVAFLMKASVAALKEYPRVNGSLVAARRLRNGDAPAATLLHPGEPERGTAV